MSHPINEQDNNSMLVDIRFEPAKAPWNTKSIITFVGDRALVHIENHSQDAIATVKKAARKLAGFTWQAELGDNWTAELSMAFISSFKGPDAKHQVKFNQQPHSKEISAWLRAYDFTVSLVNETPQNLPPVELAQNVAQWLSDLAAGKVSYDIISGEALLEHQWHGIYEVGRGSDRPPAMLDLDFNPTDDDSTPVKTVLVGKGITFDSGGYSIKTSQGMLSMKCDMAGAATVAGALGLAIMQGLKQRTRLVLCCAENLISGHAYKLGDIITYKNGTTVEVVNTDAEGRLVLADGLIRAAELQPEQIIDAATLTGAAVMALGNHYNALFALDDDMSAKAQTAADKVNEPAWRLPLEPFHQANCPSPYADTANSRPQKGGGAGGASNAAAFLSRFVPNEGKGWLHMDLAAAFHETATSTRPAGATAQGIRTIAELLQ